MGLLSKLFPRQAGAISGGEKSAVRMDGGSTSGVGYEIKPDCVSYTDYKTERTSYISSSDDGNGNTSLYRDGTYVGHIEVDNNGRHFLYNAEGHIETTWETYDDRPIVDESKIDSVLFGERTTNVRKFEEEDSIRSKSVYDVLGCGEDTSSDLFDSIGNYSDSYSTVPDYDAVDDIWDWDLDDIDMDF